MKPPAAGNPAGLNTPALLLSWGGTLSGFLLRFLHLAGFVFLFLLPAAQIIVQVRISPIIVREVTHTVGVFQFDSPCRFISSLVIVKHTVDAFIRVQHVNGFRHVDSRIKNDIVLSVKVGHGRAVLHPEREERKIVHKPLEYQTLLSRLSLLPYMGDVFRGNAAFEKGIANLVTSCHVRETDSKERSAVIGKMEFLTFSFCQFDIDTPSLQITEQCRMDKVTDFQMLEARFCPTLGKRKTDRTDVRCLFRYPV